jgi:hypothetical protein
MAIANSRPIQLEELHIRHPGLSEAASVMYASAAAVMLDANHSSPCNCAVRSGGEQVAMGVAWRDPTAEDRRVMANHIDRTEAGAYSVALAAAGERLDYVTLGRMGHGLGADWYLIPAGATVADDPHLDFERTDLVRFEVSGIESETDAEMKRRLAEKLDQLREPGMPGTAWAAVVGFHSPQVWLAELET